MTGFDVTPKLPATTPPKVAENQASFEDFMAGLGAIAALFAHADRHYRRGYTRTLEILESREARNSIPET